MICNRFYPYKSNSLFLVCFTIPFSVLIAYKTHFSTFKHFTLDVYNIPLLSNSLTSNLT